MTAVSSSARSAAHHAFQLFRAPAAERQRVARAQHDDVAVALRSSSAAHCTRGSTAVATQAVRSRSIEIWFVARLAGIENVAIDGVAAPAWAVAVTFEQGSGTFYIDRASRQFVKGVIRSPDGAELRMIRLPGD